LWLLKAKPSLWLLLLATSIANSSSTDIKPNLIKPSLIELSLIEPSLIELSLINQHWQQPITTGLDPEQLKPQSCGGCHQSQFADWRNSLHAKAMGPGVIGQFQDDATLNIHPRSKCLHCHAPLQSQQQSLTASLANKPASQLHQQGIICAACHIRDKHWYGPGQQKTSTSTNTSTNTSTSHPRAQSHGAFADPAFCASCHQFPADGPRLEGKLIQNTYFEWQASGQKRTCQNCHMPGRRHLWQGIHNKAMVLSGLTITSQWLPQKGKEVAATLSITNTGVGHYFPTYVTPRVVIQGFVQDINGQMIADSLSEYEIMRAVALDLSDEYFDTRLAPGETVDFDFQTAIPANSNASAVVLKIMVEPDYFYHQFFNQKLAQGIKPPAQKALTSARDNAKNSAYVLFEQKHSLEPY
jgi:hypothetical protein